MRKSRFSVKVPRSITHDAGLRHCRVELRQFLQEIAGLGRKLGVILVQTPASLEFDSRVAARFFASLVAAAPCGVACEPRHPSWFTSRAEAALVRHDVARVAADPAKIPGADTPGGVRSLLYYRLHGSPRMYYSAYSEDFLRALSTKVQTASAMSRQIWCIFDNTALYESWTDALQLRRLLA